MDSRPAPTDGDHRSKGPLVALIIAAVVFGLGLVMCWPDDPEPAAPNGRGFELTDEVPTAAQPAGPGMGPKAPPRCFRASSGKKFCNERPEGGSAKVYETARGLCEAAGVKKVADEFNTAANEFDAAKGYAEGFTGRPRQAAYEGCFDGFRFGPYPGRR